MTEPTPIVVIASVWIAVSCMPAGLLIRVEPDRGSRPRAWPIWRVWRVLWTLGAVSFLVHTVSAYAMVYGWSQTTALEQTRQQTAAATGFESGAGLYLNLLFAALWTLDAGRAWIRPDRVRGRVTVPALAIHGFFAFMLFNGAFVFVTGPRRWFGLGVSILFIALLAVALRRHRATAR